VRFWVLDFCPRASFLTFPPIFAGSPYRFSGDGENFLCWRGCCIDGSGCRLDSIRMGSLTRYHHDYRRWIRIGLSFTNEAACHS
jgi:hypothetical protein